MYTYVVSSCVYSQ